MVVLLVFAMPARSQPSDREDDIGHAGFPMFSHGFSVCCPRVDPGPFSFPRDSTSCLSVSGGSPWAVATTHGGIRGTFSFTVYL